MLVCRTDVSNVGSMINRGELGIRSALFPRLEGQGAVRSEPSVVWEGLT